jgi:hypothetical protein
MEDFDIERLTPEQQQEIIADVEQMYGRLQDLGPQFPPIIDNMNDIAREYHASEDPDQRNRLEGLFAEQKTDLDVKLDELDKIRQKKNTILKILTAGAAATGIGGILTGIFEAIANALGSDTAKDLIPKSTDPKDIAESGIGRIVKKKLEDLAAYFHNMYLNSTGTVQAFWHMMENAVGFLEDHLLLIIAAALAALAIELNKK